MAAPGDSKPNVLYDVQTDSQIAIEENKGGSSDDMTDMLRMGKVQEFKVRKAMVIVQYTCVDIYAYLLT